MAHLGLSRRLRHPIVSLCCPGGRRSMSIASDPCGSVSDVFWGEISPCEHLVQIYQNEGVFLDTLEGFTAGGLRSGDGVIVIATAEHLTALEERLLNAGIDLQKAALTDQYIALPADRTLAKFMIRGWPDDVLFERVVTDL